MMLTKKDLLEIGKVVKNELKPVKSDLSKVRKDVDIMLSMFDREYVDLRSRIEKIEDHLGFNQN